MSQATMDLPGTAARKPTPLTEAELVDRLRSRYEQVSQGAGVAGGVIPGVRDAAGFDAGRTIDAIAMHFWPSRGLLIDAFECKSSRSDLQRELDNPAKADDFCKLVDRFYVIVGRADLCKPDELPPDWGLLVPHGKGKLKEVKPATVLHADSPAIDEWARLATKGRRSAGPRPLPPGFNRSFIVALLRAALQQRDVRSELRAAREEGYRAGASQAEANAGRELERLRGLQETVAEFEQAFGVPLGGWRQWGPSGGAVTPADVGKTLRQLIDGDVQVNGLRNRLSAAAESAERLAAEARSQVERLDAALNPTDERIGGGAA